MALPYTEDYNYSDGDLDVRNSDWTETSGQPYIFGNELGADNGGVSLAYVNTETFSGDHYAEGTLTTETSSNYIGVAVRLQSGSASGYYLQISTSNNQLFEISSGSSTQLGSNGTDTASSGLVIRLEASSSTITPYTGGTTSGTPGAQTDSTHTGGAAGTGAVGYAEPLDTKLNDWEGGDLGGGGADPEAGLIGGKLLDGGLLMKGLLVRT